MTAWIQSPALLVRRGYLETMAGFSRVGLRVAIDYGLEEELCAPGTTSGGHEVNAMLLTITAPVTEVRSVAVRWPASVRGIGRLRATTLLNRRATRTGHHAILFECTATLPIGVSEPLVVAMHHR